MPAPRPFAVLARLEFARLHGFWRVALRDPIFDVGVLLVAGFAYASLRSALPRLLAAPPAAGLGLAIAAGVLIFTVSWGGRASRVEGGLAAGPFHLLVAEPASLRRWLVLRAAGYTLAAIVTLGVVAATIDIGAGLRFAAAAALGAAAAAGMRWFPGARVQASGAAAVRGRRPRGGRIRSPWAIAALAAIARGRPPAGAVSIAALALGALAAGLAARNNDSPDLAQAIAVLAALLAGGALFPRGRLAGLLGQTPIGLARLYGWLFWTPLATSLAGGVAIGFTAGLGPAAAPRIGLAALVALVVLSAVVFLHRMNRSERNTPLAVGLELASAAMLASVQTSLAPIWLIARGALLLRSAGRRRWLDR